MTDVTSWHDTIFLYIPRPTTGNGVGQRRPILVLMVRVLGYVNRNEWTDDYADPAAPGGTTGGTSAGTVSYNISYQDANWNWIGNEWNDQWGSGSTFNVEVE